MEKQGKISFIGLCDHVLSRHKVENQVKMSLNDKIRILCTIWSEEILFELIDYLIVKLLT